jgi:osmotically inducible lipoprotein OsmB
MKTLKIIALLAAVIFLVTGCAGMSETEKRTGTGAAAGAAAGAAIGSLYGSWGWGAAIGTAAGAAGGYLYDQTVKSKDKAYKEGYEAGKKSTAK